MRIVITRVVMMKMIIIITKKIMKMIQEKENMFLHLIIFSKMMFIQFRMFTGFSLIISGETGCGKTALIEYLFRDIFKLSIYCFIFDELNTAPKYCIPIFKYLFIDRLFEGKNTIKH
ncbi:hypothetical protein M0811_12782 [Anaeramoeba ignava]|uniref:Uncharacterized protein n=1 Tax=Anaeramoeba ignava TaxID=1746090 RepID=A0A9Q0L8U6_ANAIG|nr:hypothetical protein M0811_12782 [Anaeramoeba ignava]